MLVLLHSSRGFGTQSTIVSRMEGKLVFSQNEKKNSSMKKVTNTPSKHSAKPECVALCDDQIYATYKR